MSRARWDIIKLAGCLLMWLLFTMLLTPWIYNGVWVVLELVRVRELDLWGGGHLLEVIASRGFGFFFRFSAFLVGVLILPLCIASLSLWKGQREFAMVTKHRGLHFFTGFFLMLSLLVLVGWGMGYIGGMIGIGVMQWDVFWEKMFLGVVGASFFSIGITGACLTLFLRALDTFWAIVILAFVTSIFMLILTFEWGEVIDPESFLSGGYFVRSSLFYSGALLRGMVFFALCILLFSARCHARSLYLPFGMHIASVTFFSLTAALQCQVEHCWPFVNAEGNIGFLPLFFLFMLSCLVQLLAQPIEQ